MKAYVFPGQGAQFVGMGKDLYDNNPKAKALFDEADQILGYKITDVMFAGTDEELKQTKVTQPAVFLHSVISAICKEVSSEGNVVVPANFNCPGQLVISGNIEAVNAACEKLKAAGAKRALVLKVGGAFHSPLMEPARAELAAAIEKTEFAKPVCPVYQNYDAKAHEEPEEIKQNLIAQLTSPVRWTEEVNNMVADGATEFVECGPGKALQGMIGRICKGNESVSVHGLE